MLLSCQHPPGGTSFSRAMDWWHAARDRWMRLHELDRIGAEERQRIASDVGLTEADLVRIAREPGGTTLLIEKRLAALHLDPDDIRKLSPLLYRDLQRTCALCSEKSRCADDMATDPLAPGWDSYCPNSGTLKALT